MYLLNHIDVKNAPVATAFTFHYVSIKSYGFPANNSVNFLFTFHYVSIKSFLKLAGDKPVINLHSTMYLLNRIGFPVRCFVFHIFTFHYVSIKSRS